MALFLASLIATAAARRGPPPGPSQKMPAGFACDAKVLAYEFATQLMPERAGKGRGSLILNVAIPHSVQLLGQTVVLLCTPPSRIPPHRPLTLRRSFASTGSRLCATGLDAVALGLGVDPSTKTCTGPAPPAPGPHPHPSPPGPPPPPRPPVPAGQCSAPMEGMSLVYGAKVEDYPKTGNAADCIVRVTWQ